MLCLPFGPANVLTSASINACHHLQARTHGQGQQPLVHVLGDLTHRHTDPLRDGGHAPPTGWFWLLFFMAVPFCWCSWRNARHLPHGRSQAGDRHLKFYETRDNLFLKASTITANINQYLDVPLPAPREGPARDSVGPWVEAEDLHGG